MKTCTKCGEEKALDEFYAHSGTRDGRYAACKRCHNARTVANAKARRPRVNEYQRRWRAANREALNAKDREYRQRPDVADRLRAQGADRRAAARSWLWARKSRPCARCGGQFPPMAMQFDHLPGFEKSFEVCIRNVLSHGTDAAAAEIAKCQLVCANCHAIITWERQTGAAVESLKETA